MFSALKHFSSSVATEGHGSMCPNPYPGGSWDCRGENLGGGSGVRLNQTSL